MFLKFFKV